MGGSLSRHELSDEVSMVNSRYGGTSSSRSGAGSGGKVPLEPQATVRSYIYRRTSIAGRARGHLPGTGVIESFELRAWRLVQGK